MTLLSLVYPYYKSINKSKTFRIVKLSIVVFEGVLEDVIIKPPIGGFSTVFLTTLFYVNYTVKNQYLIV